MAGLPEPALGAILEQQHRAREAQFRAAWPGAVSLIVEVEGEPVGRLLIAESAAEIRIVDVALVERARGAGLGSALVEDLKARGKALTLSVAAASRAVGFYRRLGFVEAEGDDVYLRMRWTPG